MRENTGNRAEVVGSLQNTVFRREKQYGEGSNTILRAGNDYQYRTSAGRKYDTDGTITSGDFGFFELDQIDSSGPPSNILIKGTSLPFSNGIRTEERDKSWEGYR